MKNLFLFLMLQSIVLCVSAQVNFMQLENWSKVIEKAKAENKYIFVDAYTTWCGPCKMMDRDVYPSKVLQPYFDQNYLSVKIQMDKTQSDNDYVKGWYADAAALQTRHTINAFPALLVFSPKGELVYKEVGLRSANQLLEFAQLAKDPKMGYESLLERYQSGKIANEDLRTLALAAKKLKNMDVADKVAADYKRKVLDKLKGQAAFTERNYKFLIEFANLISTKDKWFNYLLKNPAAGDSLLKPLTNSFTVIKYVISNDEIYSKILDYSTSPASLKPIPDKSLWVEMEKSISKKYPSILADELVFAGKNYYYRRAGNWPEIIKINVEKIEKDGIDTAQRWGGYNVNAFVFGTVLKFCDDTVVLNKAIKWMEYILISQPDTEAWLDTYAAMLYKMGRINEAVAQEEKAVSAIEQKMEKNKGKNENIYNSFVKTHEEYSQILQGIKNRKPISEIWK